MPRVLRFLAVIACALAAGCGERPFYNLQWDIPEVVTLVPGESTPLPFTAQRSATYQGAWTVTFDTAPAGVTLSPSEFSVPEGQDTLTATPTLAVAADTSAQLQTTNKLFLVASDASNNITSGALVRLALLAPPAPQPDFSLGVEPRQLDLFPGQHRPVTVTVTRAAGFTGPLTVSLETSLVSLHADPLTLNADQTTGTLDVKTDSSAPVTPVTARIVATSADNRRATTGFTLNLQ